MITIAEMLSQDALTETRATCAELPWQSGTRTAGAAARAVKKNLQADLSGEVGQNLVESLRAVIEIHPVLKAAACPGRYSNLLISRTDAGGGYGWHVDNALMGRGEARLRTDLSFTLFLSEPHTYEGGALEIESASGVQSLKPAAGDLVLYPSSSLHQVAPVTSGSRLVCVGWIESLVRDAAQREILFDLQNLKAELAGKSSQNSPELLVLSKSIANLMRLWAQP